MLRNAIAPQRTRLPLLLAVLVLMGSAGARAGEHEEMCFEEATDNERIVGCGALIDGGKLTPDQLATAYANRCLAHIQRKAADPAIADCTQAIAAKPDHALAYAQRGEAHCLKGDLKNCVADFDEAMRIDPNDPSFVYLRGVARADAGDSDGAIADLTKAIDNDTGSAPAYVRRGQLYEAEGDKARAAADYRNALKIDPYDEATKQRLDAFRK